ncbi:MAG TPA: alkaline phosphatase family protein [Candidatus Dormibacteraeota bacterium]|nr:alkaline phosphatase family protein [Candidatus Dormibacteraeota bacterium]
MRLRAEARLLLLAALLTACSPSPAVHTPGPSAHATASAAPIATAPATPGPTPSASPLPTPVPPPPGVVLLVLENTSYDAVVGGDSAPSLNALARRYGLATQSYAFGHPSLPNYLALVAGTNLGIDSDCTDCSVSGPSIADQLTARGLSWGAYLEDMPSPCYTGAAVDDTYGKKHNPFMYFPQIRDDPAQCNRDQPFSAFYPALDGGTLPAFSLVVPNLCDDGHNCSLSHSDSWVGGFSAHVTGSAWFQRGGVLIVTYDEGSGGAGCCNGAAGGRIATIVVSAATPAGARLDTPVTHAGVLRTVEELYGLPFLAAAACACSGDLLPLLGR